MNVPVWVLFLQLISVALDIVIYQIKRQDFSCLIYAIIFALLMEFLLYINLDYKIFLNLLHEIYDFYILEFSAPGILTLPFGSSIRYQYFYNLLLHINTLKLCLLQYIFYSFLALVRWIVIFL